MWPVLMGEAPAYSGPRTPDGRVSCFVIFPICKGCQRLLKDIYLSFVFNFTILGCLSCVMVILHDFLTLSLANV